MWATFRKHLWNWRGIWFTTPTIAGLVLLLRLTGWLQPLEWMALDQYIRFRPAEPQDDRIVIVGITERDIRQLGRYPMDDATLAKAIAQIKRYQPRAIGLDLYRDLPYEPGHQQLVKVLSSTPNLIGIEKPSGSEDFAAVAPPPVLKERNQVASNNVVLDGDGKLRRGLLYWTSPDGSVSLESLGLRLALMYLEAKGITPQHASENSDYMQLRQAVFPIFNANDGSYVGADDGGYQILLNFRGAAKTFRTVPLMDVLQGRISPDLLRDRIVLIGPTAESLKDFFYTPYSGNSITTPEKMPGVEVQANIASHVLSATLDGRHQIQVWSDDIEIAWIVLWSGIGALLGWCVRSPRWAILAMSVAEGSLLLGGYVALLHGWWIPVVPPALALVSSAIVLTGYLGNQERRDRQIVMNLFGRYVTPTIAETIWRDRDQLLKQGRMKGQKMTATVLFTDLQNFSGIAEHSDPETLMEWLNEYMDAMTQVIFQQGAVVDKFIGDAIMAVFGVPIAHTDEAEVQRDAHNAVQCALTMASTLAALNRKWQSEGRPTVNMRVGISTGTVVTGSLGGQQRMDYTAIGDSVNVAARLESFDKSVDGGLCRILISDATQALVAGAFEMQAIGSVQLKGREQPMQIHQVLLPQMSQLMDVPGMDSVAISLPSNTENSTKLDSFTREI